MSNLSHKSKVKANFFISELECVSEIKETMITIHAHTKKCLNESKPATLGARIKTMRKAIHKLNRALKINEFESKIESCLELDPQKIEETQFFEHYDLKIEDLNDKLIIAESLVQQAENIKREMDKKIGGYQVTPYKHFKHLRQHRNLQAYIRVKFSLNHEISRTIHILKQIEEKSKHKNIFNLQLSELAQLKRQGMNYHEYSLYRSNQEIRRRSKSCEKFCIMPNPQPQPSLIAKIIRSNYCKKAFIDAFREKIYQMKKKNQSNRSMNSYLAEAIERQNKKAVLEHLQTQNDLDYEESLARIQLQAQNLTKNIDQKLLSLLSLKKRAGKSADKRTKNEVNPQRRHSSVEKNGNNLEILQELQKKNKI